MSYTDFICNCTTFKICLAFWCEHTFIQISYQQGCYKSPFERHSCCKTGSGIYSAGLQFKLAFPSLSNKETWILINIVEKFGVPHHHLNDSLNIKQICVAFYVRAISTVCQLTLVSQRHCVECLLRQPCLTSCLLSKP